MSAEASDVGDRVRAIIARQARREPADLTDGTEIAALGIESIDTIEMVFAIEEAFGIEIPFNANTPESFDMRTVGDIVRSVTGIVDAG